MPLRLNWRRLGVKPRLLSWATSDRSTLPHTTEARMTLDSILRKIGSDVARHVERPTQRVDAVFDDEIWSILKSYGLLAPLDAGEMRCHLTGVPLTRENLGGLIGTANGPRLIADTFLWGERTGADG